MLQSLIHPATSPTGMPNVAPRKAPSPLPMKRNDSLVLPDSPFPICAHSHSTAEAWGLDPAILNFDLGPPPLDFSSIPNPSPLDREKDFCRRRRGENWTFYSELQDEWLTEIECAEMIKLLENELKYPASHVLRKGPQRELDHDTLKELHVGFVSRFKSGEFRKQGDYPDLDERERKRSEEIKIAEKRKYEAEKARKRREDLSEVPDPSGCIRFDKMFAEGLEMISSIKWDVPKPEMMSEPWKGEPSPDTWEKFQIIFDNGLKMTEKHQKEGRADIKLRNILEKWGMMADNGKAETEAQPNTELPGLDGLVESCEEVTDFRLRNFLLEDVDEFQGLFAELQWGDVPPPPERIKKTTEATIASSEELEGAHAALEADPRPSPLAVLQSDTAEKGGANPHKRRAVGVPGATPAKRRRVSPLPPPLRNVAPAAPRAPATPPMVPPMHMAGHQFRQAPGHGMPLWHSSPQPPPPPPPPPPPSASTRKRKAPESPLRAAPVKRGTAVPQPIVPPGPWANGRGSVPPTPGTAWYPTQGPPSGVPLSLIPRGAVTAALPLQSPLFPPPALAVNPPPPPAAANNPQLQQQQVYIDLTLSPGLTAAATSAPAPPSVKRQRVSAAAKPAAKPRKPRKPKNPAPLPPIPLPPPYRRLPTA
jgi:hypothetical protein